MLSWVDSGAGWTAGRYRVCPAAAGGWHLVVSGRTVGSYRRGSSARAAAGRIERLRRRRGRILLRSIGLAAVAAAGVVVFLVRIGDDPARAEAVELARRIDAAYLAVGSGTPIEEISDPAFAAEAVPLPTGGEVFMFTGEAGGDCYSFYWNQRRGPIARLLVGGLACEPGPASVQSAHHVYHRQTPWTAGHLPGISVAFDWDDVLPDPQRLRPWVVPVLLVLGTAGLYLVVGITRDLLGVEPERRRRAPGPGASEVAV